ncbi:neprilysin-1 isoform X2 [Tetranychus urticae]|uniref:Peptidase M13 N-terminal domain-containing protein n=1 Tax=Tetranychus urticae TaxID=32264 RepID=T1JT81_TETUR|nr:neprilysin-1 isoform X2 [Tetranychus urticae]
MPVATTSYVILSLLAVSPFVTFFFAQSSKSKGESTISNTTKDNVCRSPLCVSEAHRILESIDDKIDPCQDFYQFACGNWLKTNPLPTDRLKWSPLDKLEIRVKRQIKALFEAKNEKNLTWTPYSTAINIYERCLDKESTIGYKSLKRLIKRIGGWPMVQSKWDSNRFEPENTSILLRTMYGLNWIFGIYLFTEGQGDKLQTYLLLDSPSFGVERKYLSSYTNNMRLQSRQLNPYRWYIESLSRLVADEGVNEKQWSNEINRIMTFEASLMEITTDMDSKVQRSIQVSQLANHYPKIRWFSLIKQIFTANNIPMSSEMTIYINDHNYYLHLGDVIRKTPKRVIANYLGWRVAEHYGVYSSEEIRDLRFQFDRTFLGVQQQPERWEFCYDMISSRLPFIIGRLYIDNYFNEKARDDLLKLIGETKRQLRFQLEDSNWLDASTKLEALDKLSHMIDIVGYQDWIKDNSQLERYYFEIENMRSEDLLDDILLMDKAKTFREFSELNQMIGREQMHVMSPTDVNAYNYLRRNLLSFPAALLQNPLYTYGLPPALNYGGIGWIIGHEIIHAFDSDGKRFDKYGNLRNWWSNSTFQTYLTKSSCFLDQYSQLIGSTNGANSIMTLSENIADTVGLELAFSAFKANFDSQKLTKKSLFSSSKSILKGYNQLKHSTDTNHYLPPELIKFTPEQLFFLSFAQIWCTNQTTENEQVRGQSRHSPEKIRVLGPLRNSQDFARAFQCQSSSPMAFDERCTLWR